jgi:NADH dehydrogenase FAD-containing subunit
MQIMDDSLPNVYAIGDVTESGVTNPNGRIAVTQGMITVSNLLLAMKGEQPKNKFTPHWGLEFIKLTLGLVSATILDASRHDPRSKSLANTAIVTGQLCYSIRRRVPRAAHLIQENSRLA